MNGTAISIEPEDLELSPFNMSDWSRGGGMRQDVRWKFGMPLVNNANYAWIQHSIHHLSPVGVSGFVMANSAAAVPPPNRNSAASSPHELYVTRND